MLNILIVDDDSRKIENIMSELVNLADLDEDNIKVALDINQARKSLMEYQFDLLILDIQLPTRLGKDINRDGGLILLREILNGKRLVLPNNIICVTSSSDMLKECEGQLKENLITIVECNPTYDLWKKQIKNKIEYLLRTKKQVEKKESYDYDLTIITAVKREYESILRLPGEWKEHNLVNDSTVYQIGYFTDTNDMKYKVVLAQQHEMGMTAAAVLSMKLINSYRPKYLFMSGIAAGNKKQGVNLGDIIIVAESWDYGSGKIKDNVDDGEFIFQPEPHQLLIDIELKEKFSKNFNQALFNIWSAWPDKKPSNMLSVHVGALASGAAVIQNENIVKEYIDKHNRKLLGIDMETYGVYYASNNVSRPRPKVVSIKSVCDFADNLKNDEFQHYAAYTSASFLYYLATSVLFD